MTVKIGKEFDEALLAYAWELFANESAARMDAKLEKVRELIAAVQAERNQALLDAERAREERSRVGVEIRRELLGQMADIEQKTLERAAQICDERAKYYPTLGPTAVNREAASIGARIRALMEKV